MTVAKVSKMRKAEIIELLKNAGVAYSEDLTKAELVKLYEAQMDQVNDFLNEVEENQIEEGVVSMNNEIKEVEEVMEEVEVLDEVEIVDETEVELEDAAVEIVDSVEEDTDSSEEVSEVEEKTEEKPKAPGRAAGIGVQFFANDELQDVFPSIQATARFVKEYLNRDTMPYALIHKSLRDHIDYTHTDGNVLKFRFENDEDRKEEYKTRTSKSNGSRGAGKIVDWFENGEFKKQFPSIKATVEHMKDYLALPHNPYTAVLKSLNENQDFNQHSFKYAEEAIEDLQEETVEEVVETSEAVEEIQEEIVEIEEVEIEEAQ